MTNECSDPAIGSLITLYELGTLNRREATRFENHVLNCDFCRKELVKFNVVVTTVNQDREEILSGLKESGLDFSSQRRLLMEQLP